MKIGRLASCYAFRHPSILAKAVATIDDMSNGRIIIIPVLGACSYEGEFGPYGFRWLTPGERVERLAKRISSGLEEDMD